MKMPTTIVITVIVAFGEKIRKPPMASEKTPDTSMSHQALLRSSL